MCHRDGVRCGTIAAAVIWAGLFTTVGFAQQPAAQDNARAIAEQIERKLVKGQRIDFELWRIYANGTKELYGRFHDWFQRGKDVHSKRSALMLMWRRRMPDLDKAVLEALDSDDPRLRRMALDYLPSAKRHARVVDVIRKALKSEDVEVRWLAAKAMAQIPRALTAMPDQARRLAADEDPIIRQALLANFVKGEGVEPIASPILVAAAMRPDPMARMAAARALRRLGVFPAGKADERLDAVVGRAVADLGSEDTRVEGGASYVLLELWNGQVEKRIRAALSDGDLWRRARAGDLLRKRKLAFPPKPLAEVIRRGSEAQQLFVCGTLSRVAWEDCVGPLKLALASPHASVRQAAVYALELTARPSAVKALTEALAHKDANVRLRAARVLGRRSAAEALGALKRAAAADADAEVRHAARIAAALVGGEGPQAVLEPAGEMRKRLARLDPATMRRSAGKKTTVRDGVMQVGGQKQLFVDDLVVADLGGAVRQVHKFKRDPRNPVLEQQFPWELRGTATYCTPVYYDPAQRLCVMWYISSGRLGKRGTPSYRRARLIAYSRDGVHWRRPDTNTHELNGSKHNNATGRADNVVPLADAKDPNRRFAAFDQESNRLTVSFSPTGVSDWTQPKVITSIAGDVVTVCRDPLGGGFFGFLKARYGRWFRRGAWSAWGPTPERITKGRMNLTGSFADDRRSADRIAAAFHGVDFFQPERFHTEIYEVTPFVYEGMYFGLPVLFDVSGAGGANVDGPTTLALIAGRDPLGQNGWLRPASGGPGTLPKAAAEAQGEAVEGALPALQPVIDRGRWGEWDSTMLYGPSTLLVVDDQIVLYYTGAAFGHEPEGSKSDYTTAGNFARTAIGRATLRLDGMVSLRAAQREAAVTTRPLAFEGARLVVNAACPDGSLRVELLDAKGNVIDAYRRHRCAPFRGDAVRHTVTWAGKSDVSPLAARTIRVRFLLQQADLYAFTFTAP